MNLALNKLPFEGSVWSKSHLATDGRVEKYTGGDGFAFARWPASYTIDLGGEYPVSTIRFLLWDNLGQGQVNDVRSSRVYKYTLLTSPDNINWTKQYDTGNEGYNGWQVFVFRTAIKARYVRLEAKYNSQNEDFHLVEFEVHDTPAHEILSNNTRTIILPLDNIENYDEVKVREALEDLTKYKEESEKGALRIKELEDKLINIDQTYQNLAAKAVVNERRFGFNDEAIENKKLAQYWFGGIILTSLTLLAFVLCFLFCKDNVFVKLANDNLIGKVISSNADFMRTTLVFEFFKSIALRALLISLLIYILVICIKNYNAQMHNYTINMHKSNSLTAIVGLSERINNGANQENFIVQAAQLIFSHQKSGYSGKEPNPNILTKILTKDS